MWMRIGCIIPWRVNKKFRQNMTPRGIIPPRVSLFYTKVRITQEKNHNQNRKYLNTLISGPCWFEWRKKTGSRKSRWTVPLNLNTNFPSSSLWHLFLRIVGNFFISCVQIQEVCHNADLDPNSQHGFSSKLFFGKKLKHLFYYLPIYLLLSDDHLPDVVNVCVWYRPI